MDTSTQTNASINQAAGGTAALEAIDIRKSLPLGRERIDILKGISLRINHGEFVAIVGPSGSGKSTLLGIIAGLDNPTSGQVLVDGVDITNISEGKLAAVRNQKIGMVFQAFNLIPTLTAQENVEVPLYVGKHPGSPSARAQELLNLVGLAIASATSPTSSPAASSSASPSRGRWRPTPPSSSWTSRPATSTRTTATTCSR